MAHKGINGRPDKDRTNHQRTQHRQRIEELHRTANEQAEQRDTNNNRTKQKNETKCLAEKHCQPLGSRAMAGLGLLCVCTSFYMSWNEFGWENLQFLLWPSKVIDPMDNRAACVRIIYPYNTYRRMECNTKRTSGNCV